MQKVWTRGVALAVAAVVACAAGNAAAVDTSAPAILQMFEAKWTTIEDRMADIFAAGYGQMWLPPPQRADTSDFSVGYDLFDRFDLGQPRNETLYGTEMSLKTTIGAAHRASVSMYTDLILNHNGFTNLGTVDTQGTSSTEDDVSVAQAGGYYPGFVLSLPDDADGDFHGAFEGGDFNGRLGTLIDIAQEKNHQFIRHPTTAGDPQNIPAGTIGIFGRPPANLPDPNNARFYPDRDLAGTSLNDPELGAMTTRYPFNPDNPIGGDPTVENALGLLMRNAQWMIQAIGVDGFRIDAAKHMPEWVLDHIDRAVFRASFQTNFDGTIKPTFMFSEVLDGNKGTVQTYIRKNLPNPHGIDPNDTTVAGNRDALDFPLFFAMRDNLTDNQFFQNNWHGIRNASQDTQDDGLRNGSQGVAFVDSHDNIGGGFPYLYKVAYAYTLMKPGNAIVYLNAQEFGDNRTFPHNEGGNTNPMSNDALGGYHGDAIAKLVEIRNSHGRGNFQERWIDEAFGDTNGDGQKSDIYVYERSNSAIVGLNNRLDSGYDQRSPVQTDFAANTVLVELTGNADDSVVDPGGNIPKTIRVNGSGQVTIRIPRNASHGKGYVVYGVAQPQGALSLTNVAQVLDGATPTSANNGTARLSDIDVITAGSFSVRLDTTPVTLEAPFGESQPYRDFDADGDNALIKIDGGINLNNLPGIDITNPSSHSHGFEQFTDTRVPGYIDNGSGGNSGSGTGLYIQNIDATQLAEGRHYLTARAFRHRNVSGTAVFSDFRRTVYIDRLPPEAAIVSFDPFATAPTNPNNRDMIVRSVDGTANNMHIFLDLPAGMMPADILDRVQQGFNHAGYYDRDQFILAFSGLATGNHVATIVSFEPTGNFNIQRMPGLFTDTTLGAGFGDMNSNGLFTVSDIRCSGSVCNNNSVEDILYSQNSKFRAAFDVNGDGLGDNRDLFLLENELVGAGAGQAVLNSYVGLLLKRGDVNSSGGTDTADVAALYSNFGAGTWLYDMNVDGLVNTADVSTMITELFRTVPGDFDLDGIVDARDYVILRKQLGTTGALYTQGDGDFDGDVDENDLVVWQRGYGFIRQPLTAGAGSGSTAAVPEPATLVVAVFAAAMMYLTVRTQRTRMALATVTVRTSGS